jgi:hypothetical protein
MVTTLRICQQEVAGIKFDIPLKRAIVQGFTVQDSFRIATLN